MSPSADEPLEIVAGLKSRGLKVPGSDAVPGSEGRTLHNVLRKRIVGDCLSTPVSAPGGRTQGARLLQPNAHDAHGARTERCDFVCDATREGHRPADRAMIDGVVGWFTDATAHTPSDPPDAPTVSVPPKASAALTAEVKCIEDALSLAITSGEVAGFAGWSSAGIAVAALPAGLVPSVERARGEHGLSLHLLPSGGDSRALYGTDRSDVVDDDQRSAEGDRDSAGIEGLAAWHRKAFPAGDRSRRVERARRPALRAKNLSHDPPRTRRRRRNQQRPLRPRQVMLDAFSACLAASDCARVRASRPSAMTPRSRDGSTLNCL